MALNQTKVLAVIKEALGNAGYTFGKNIKRDKSRREFNLGGSWAEAGMVGITDKSTIKPIEDVYKRVVGHIIIKKDKVPGMPAWTKIFITPASTVDKGQIIWDSDSWFMNFNDEDIIKYIEKENA